MTVQNFINKTNMPHNPVVNRYIQVLTTTIIKGSKVSTWGKSSWICYTQTTFSKHTLLVSFSLVIVSFQLSNCSSFSFILVYTRYQQHALFILIATRWSTLLYVQAVPRCSYSAALTPCTDILLHSRVISISFTVKSHTFKYNASHLGIPTYMCIYGLWEW